MATLHELLQECNLVEKPAPELSKTASTTEVDAVLRDLGLAGEVTNQSNTEENVMSGLTDIYNSLLGGETSAAEVTEKVASEAGVETAEGASDASTAFGERVGEYFNVMTDAFIEKIADEKPLQHLDPKGQMTAAIGKENDPRLEVNHSASDGKPVAATTGGNSPYSLKDKAMLKAYLSRGMAGEVGNLIQSSSK